MKNRLAVAILSVIVAATIVGVAQAQIHATIEVRDINNNLINGGSVPLGTTVYVHGTYSDDLGAPASAVMQVFFNGAGPETLYSGGIDSGETITRTHTLTQLGSYEFRWTVTKTLGGTTATGTPTTQCIQQRALAYTTVFVIPEPATLAGLVMALSAFGLLAVKRKRH